MRSRYSAIQAPRPVDLRGAPAMRYWLIEPEEHGDGAVLTGLVDGRRRTTGTVLAYDPAEGWALTWSGLYRLGIPADPVLSGMVDLGPACDAQGDLAGEDAAQRNIRGPR